MLSKHDIAALANIWSFAGFFPTSQPNQSQGMRLLFPVAISNLLQISLDVSWGKVCLLMILLVVVCLTATATFCFFVTAFLRRKLILLDRNDTESREFLGKPLLFPTRLSHARMFPERYHYWYRYFVVGVPVGLCGKVGNVLSIDERRPGKNGGVDARSRRWCWFTIDQRYYMEPGDHPNGLRGKLDTWLCARGEDPNQWPYAYLISTPKFLWFTRNPVSWWFLYSPTKELSAMVTEVNNSFSERQLTFFRLKHATREVERTDESPVAEMEEAILATIGPTRSQASVRFLSSNSKFHSYRAHWEKDIFLSPFEKVEGYFTTSCNDPCNILDRPPRGHLESTSTLCTPDRKPKIVSRIYSWGTPVDPLADSGWDIIKFISQWGYVGALAKPQIIYEALRLLLRGNMPFLKKPEIRVSNIPRNETDLERSVERFFRLYLRHITAHSPRPLVLVYKPSKSHSLRPEKFLSCHFTGDDPESVPDETPTLTIQVVTPRFYTNILQYADPSTGFATEMQPIPHIADSGSQLLRSSDPQLLQQLVASVSLTPQPSKDDVCEPKYRTWIGRARGIVVSLLQRRGQPQPPFMDRFVYNYLSLPLQAQYQDDLIKFWVAERFTTGGSQRVAAAYYSIGRALIAWTALWLLYFVLNRVTGLRGEEMPIYCSAFLLLYSVQGYVVGLFQKGCVFPC